MKKFGKDFDELRHKFDRKETDGYRKTYYDVKNYEDLSISKIKTASKSLNKIKKGLRFKKFRGNIDSVNMKTLKIMIIIMILLMMMNIEKLGVLEHYLKN